MKILHFTTMALFLGGVPLLCENNIQTKTETELLDESNNTNTGTNSEKLTERLAEWNEKPSTLASVLHWGIKLIPTYFFGPLFLKEAPSEFERANSERSKSRHDFAFCLEREGFKMKLLGVACLGAPACAHLLMEAYKKVCSTERRDFLSQLNTAIANNCFVQLCISVALVGLALRDTP